MKGSEQSGFTLIEIMIVIAIIGILSAIAIPNFISYRNKTYCASVESDVSNIIAGISGYFSEPNRTSIPLIIDLVRLDLSPHSTGVVITGSPDVTIGVHLEDLSGRCARGETFYKVMGQSEGIWY